jgi:UMF1 family MFS transporter
LAEPTRRAPWSEIFGWAMFDFANSSYTTVIITVVYSVVFPRLIVADGPEFRQGNLLWSVALSISYGLTVLTVPILGAVMDHSGSKKRWLAASWLLTVFTTALLWLGTPDLVWLAMLSLIISNWGFSIGESFTASFLPDLGPPEDLGRISGMAWGLGYIGGLLCTALVIFGLGPQTPENFENMRLVGPVVAAFFFFAALPTFLLLKDRGEGRPLPPGETWMSVGFSQLVTTARDLPKFRDLSWFFASFFFAMAGLSIVVAFAFIYGDQVIHWKASTQTLMFVVTQLTAAGGALAFGWLQSRLGDLRTYALTLVVWTFTVGLIAWAKPLSTAIGMDPETFFLGAGCFAGACLGATQSAARTLVALFAPSDRIGEFFGVWGVFGKLAAIFGLLSLGLLQSWLGLENAILVCGLFYLIAFALSFKVDEARARAQAAG